LFEPEPENLPEGKKVPLVVYLHGAGSADTTTKRSCQLLAEKAPPTSHILVAEKTPLLYSGYPVSSRKAHASDRVAKNEADLIRGIINGSRA
jgi:hypothetical protein